MCNLYVLDYFFPTRPLGHKKTNLASVKTNCKHKQELNLSLPRYVLFFGQLIMTTVCAADRRHVDLRSHLAISWNCPKAMIRVYLYRYFFFMLAAAACCARNKLIN